MVVVSELWIVGLFERYVPVDFVFSLPPCGSRAFFLLFYPFRVSLVRVGGVVNPRNVSPVSPVFCETFNLFVFLYRLFIFNPVDVLIDDLREEAGVR